MPIEVRLRSLDAARPNEELWRQIEAKQGDLVTFLRDEEPGLESARVEPLGGFPTGVEPFVIVIALAFAAGFAKGFAEGAGEEIGKAVGTHAGRKVGARIRLWLQKTFPDIEIAEVKEG